MNLKSPDKAGGMREMMTLALPMIISYACDTIMMFTDRLLLSKISPDLMNAAVGGGIASFLFASFGFGLIGYSTALVAQYFGAGQKHNCAVVTFQCMLTALGLYPLTLMCRPAAHHLFHVLGVPASQIDAQIIFFDILLYGSILIFLRQAFCSFFSGIGRTGVVMAAGLTAMVINVAVSYILIFGRFGAPALGITGAGLGTLAGSLSALAVLGAAFFSKKNRKEFSVFDSLYFDRGILRKFLRFGYPSGIELFLSLVAANGLVMTFHSMGPVTATAASIVMNWDMAVYIPLMGMEVAVTSLVGRYIGAGRLDYAHRSTLSGLRLGILYASVLLFLFSLFPGPLAAIFHPAQADATFEEARPLAIAMLRMIALYVLSIVIVIVFVGALRGAGDTLWAMTYHVTLHWTCVAVLFGATRFLKLPPDQAWGLLIVVFLMLSSLAWLRYRSGRWKDIRVLG